MSLKPCKQCGKEFVSADRRKKYCSDPCLIAGKKLVNKRYQQSEKGKEVKKRAMKKYRPKNYEKEKIYIKKYQKSDKYKVAVKRYQKSEKGKKTILSNYKRRRQREKFDPKYIDRVKQLNKQRWQRENDDPVQITQRQERRKKRIDRMREYMKKYISVRKKEDYLFKLAINMRQRLRNYLKSSRHNKNYKNFTFQMVGCSPKQLATHIEKQFKNGMSWNNYKHKIWQIDHIMPLSSAKNYDDLVKLCHYTNLQPLWTQENQIKSDKILPTDL